jgi:hypothetical protein
MFLATGGTESAECARSGPRKARGLCAFVLVLVFGQEKLMLSATEAQPYVSAAGRIDWGEIRYALIHTMYALLLVLVMLLPANFVAYALCSTLYHGGALGGAHYAAVHHLSGYWLGTSDSAMEVGALLWWMAAIWEWLFWASCASGLLLFVLWAARLTVEQVNAHIWAARRLRPRPRHVLSR